MTALPPDRPAYVFLHAAGGGQHLRKANGDRWLQIAEFADSDADVDPMALTSAVAAARLPPAPGHALLFGETGALRQLRGYLREQQGWPRPSIHLRPHWTRGRSGM